VKRSVSTRHDRSSQPM